VIRAHHLPPTLQTAEGSSCPQPRTLEAAVDDVEREMLLDALKTSRGNMAKAARELGLTERVMGLRVRKHALDARAFRTSG
jgi:Nif-specific regulatory protein